MKLDDHGVEQEDAATDIMFTASSAPHEVALPFHLLSSASDSESATCHPVFRFSRCFVEVSLCVCVV